mmetsp:Transcript_31225/g.78648  ORF Transcript_31225/g.78648 Transcript_31225/m.78648 type:complete len:389 (+) Transcript_31225:512-1678(+)
MRLQPDGEGEAGAEQLVDFIVFAVLCEGWALFQRLPCDAVQNMNTVVLAAGLSFLQRQGQAGLEDARGEVFLCVPLVLHGDLDVLLLQKFVIIALPDAVAKNDGPQVLVGRDVQKDGLGPLGSQGDILLEGAPDPREWGGRARVLLLLVTVEDEEDADGEVQSLVEARLAGVGGHLASQGVLPVRVRANPVACRGQRQPPLGVLFDAAEEILDDFAPPVAAEPIRFLALARQELDKGAIVLLGRRHDQPSVDHVQVQNAHSARHARGLRIRLRRCVVPLQAVVLEVVLEPPQLRDADGAVLRLWDVALERERLHDACDVLLCARLQALPGQGGHLDGLDLPVLQVHLQTRVGLALEPIHELGHVQHAVSILVGRSQHAIDIFGGHRLI